MSNKFKLSIGVNTTVISIDSMTAGYKRHKENRIYKTVNMGATSVKLVRSRSNASIHMATATSDRIPRASLQSQQVTVVTGNSKTNGKVISTSITDQEKEVKPNDEKAHESNVTLPSTTVEKNKLTDSSEDEEPKSTGVGSKVLTVLIMVLKFIVLGQLIAAVGLQVQSLFNSDWGYDEYSDYGYIGKIHHSLWGFHEEGISHLFALYKEGYWQDWKKPIIKFQCIALGLGIAGTLDHVILVALTFVRPQKVVQISLLTAVILLSSGCGGLVLKTTADFQKSRPVLGFARSAISPSTILETCTQEGYTQAIASGATYLAAAIFSIVLVVLTAVKHRKDSTKVTPIKSAQNE